MMIIAAAMAMEEGATARWGRPRQPTADLSQLVPGGVRGFETLERGRRRERRSGQAWACAQYAKSVGSEAVGDIIPTCPSMEQDTTHHHLRPGHHTPEAPPGPPLDAHSHLLRYGRPPLALQLEHPSKPGPTPHPLLADRHFLICNFALRRPRFTPAASRHQVMRVHSSHGIAPGAAGSPYRSANGVLRLIAAEEEQSTGCVQWKSVSFEAAVFSCNASRPATQHSHLEEGLFCTHSFVPDRCRWHHSSLRVAGWCGGNSVLLVCFEPFSRVCAVVASTDRAKKSQQATPMA